MDPYGWDPMAGQGIGLAPAPSLAPDALARIGAAANAVLGCLRCSGVRLESLDPRRLEASPGSAALCAGIPSLGESGL